MLKKHLKKLLKKNEKIFYLAYCIDNMKSSKFRKKVLEIKTNPYKFSFDHNGLNYNHEMIYIIVVGDETKGFCSAIRDTLYYLMYADSLGMKPYIEYTHNMPYQENEIINGGTNSFEYFYKQPCGLTQEILTEAMAVIPCESVHTEGVFRLRGIEEPKGYYSNQEKHIDICACIYKDYMHLKNEIEEQFSQEIKQIIQGKVIGVHYRGTDFKVGYNGHPVAVQYQRHIEKVEELLATGNYDRIFLATEDGDVIQEFQNKFGNKLTMYSDVVRGTGETNAYNMNVIRKNHHYRLAYEVLRDVYTLASCDAFVSSVSGVGIMSQIIKKSKGTSFETIKMLDAGINKTNKVLQKKVF